MPVPRPSSAPSFRTRNCALADTGVSAVPAGEVRHPPVFDPAGTMRGRTHREPTRNGDCRAGRHQGVGQRLGLQLWADRSPDRFRGSARTGDSARGCERDVLGAWLQRIVNAITTWAPTVEWTAVGTMRVSRDAHDRGAAPFAGHRWGIACGFRRGPSRRSCYGESAPDLRRWSGGRGI